MFLQTRQLASGLGVSQRGFSELGAEDEDALSHPLSEALQHALGLLLICFGAN